MYIGKTPEEAFAEKKIELITPCHVWCNLTQSVVGLDDGPAGKEICTSGRSCYEA